MLGGVRQAKFPLYFAVPLDTPEKMTDYVRARREECIHRFQLKIGGDQVLDGIRAKHIIDNTGQEDLIVGDANCGGRLTEDIIAVRATDELTSFNLVKSYKRRSGKSGVRKS